MNCQPLKKENFSYQFAPIVHDAGRPFSDSFYDVGHGYPYSNGVPLSVVPETYNRRAHPRSRLYKNQMDSNISKSRLSGDSGNLAETRRPYESDRGSLVRKVNCQPRVWGRRRARGCRNAKTGTKTLNTGSGCTNPHQHTTTFTHSSKSVDTRAGSVILASSSKEASESYNGEIDSISMAKGGHAVQCLFTSVRERTSEKAGGPDNSVKYVTDLKVNAAASVSVPCMSEKAQNSLQHASQNVPDIPELSMSDFTIQFEDEQPKKEARRRHVKDQTLCGNEGVCIPSPSTRIPSIPEPTLSDFTIQFEDEQPRKPNRRRHAKDVCDKTLSRNEGIGVPSPSTRIPSIPELTMSDFTIQFEDEQPRKPNRRQHAKDVCDKTLSRNEGVNVPSSSTQTGNSPNLPEFRMSDFTIQFEDEQPRSEKGRREEKVGSPRKKRRARRSSISTDIDRANIIISPAVESPDILLPLPSMRRSSRLRRKSVELYRSCMKSAEILSDIANSGRKGNESEPSLLLPAISTVASCVISENENCSFSPKTPETRCSTVSSNPGDDPPVRVKCNEEQLTPNACSKVELTTLVKSVENVIFESQGIGSSVECNPALECDADVAGTVSLIVEDNICQAGAGDSLVNGLESIKPPDQSVECDQVPTLESATKRPVRARAQRIRLTQSPSTPDTPSPPSKKSRRKSQRKEPEIGIDMIEELYLNKNFKMPELRSWETIYESPGPGQGDLGKKKLKRSLLFEEDPNMHAKYKKRRKKAIKNGWKPLSKAKLNKANKKLLEKLKLFEEELALVKLDNSQAEGTSAITPTAVVNLANCSTIEKDVLSPICESSKSSPLVHSSEAFETGEKEGGTEEDLAAVFPPVEWPIHRQISPLAPVDNEISSVAGHVCQEDVISVQTVFQGDKTSESTKDKEAVSVSVPEDTLGDGCCLWRENTCDWSNFSTVVTAGTHSVSCLEEDVAVRGDVSAESDQLEDHCLHNICQTEINSPEDSAKVLPSDSSKSPTSDVKPCMLANVETILEATTKVVVNNNSAEKERSLKDQPCSALTLNNIPNRPSERDVNRANNYWEKMNIFQNIFS